MRFPLLEEPRYDDIVDELDALRLRVLDHGLRHPEPHKVGYGADGGPSLVDAYLDAVITHLEDALGPFLGEDLDEALVVKSLSDF